MIFPLDERKLLRFQEPEEIYPALGFLKERKPASYLELGSACGISLQLAMEAFGPACKYRAIDLMDREAERDRLLEVLNAYRGAGYDLELLQAASQQTATVQWAEKHGPYDVVFIDADHTFRASLADVLNYAPLLNEDGVLMLHDVDQLGILDVIHKYSCEKAYVRHLWMALKALLPKDAIHEFIVDKGPGQPRKGIGFIEARALSGLGNAWE